MEQMLECQRCVADDPTNTQSLYASLLEFGPFHCMLREFSYEKDLRVKSKEMNACDLKPES